MLNIVSFIWSSKPSDKYKIPTQDMGINYDESYVNKMYSMLQRNLTTPFKYTLVIDSLNKHIISKINPEIATINLWDTFSELGGCYRRLYTFSKDMKNLLGERFACIDLDTVIVANVDHIFGREEDFVYFKVPGASGIGSRMNCGLYMMTAGTRNFVWEDFKANPQKAVQESRVKFAGTDQAWCNYTLDLDNEAFWDISEGHYNIRQHFIEPGNLILPSNACMIHWPGPRDPNETKWSKYEWLKKHYI